MPIHMFISGHHILKNYSKVFLTVCCIYVHLSHFECLLRACHCLFPIVVVLSFILHSKPLTVFLVLYYSHNFSIICKQIHELEMFSSTSFMHLLSLFSSLTFHLTVTFSLFVCFTFPIQVVCHSRQHRFL